MARYTDADAFRNMIMCQPKNMSANYVLELISKAPTADVAEVKHGKWIYSIKPLAGGRYVSGRICSVCKKRIMRHRKSNFCPNCGATMDGERRTDEEPT